MMSKKEQEEIRQEAKEILDNFALALERVEIKEKKLKRASGGYRVEGSGENGDSEFLKSVFDNAPEKEGDCIVAEKKKW